MVVLLARDAMSLAALLVECLIDQIVVFLAAIPVTYLNYVLFVQSCKMISSLQSLDITKFQNFGILFFASV